METKSIMENKRVGFKSWKENENVVPDEIYHRSVDDIISGEQGGCHQSCICDPAFINNDSSSSNSGDSYMSNDLTNGDYYQQDFDIEAPIQPQCEWASDDSCQKTFAEEWCTPAESLESQDGVYVQGVHSRYGPVKHNCAGSSSKKGCQSTDFLYDEPHINKVLIINDGVEPYHVRRLIKTNPQLPKLNLGGCENYNKSTNLYDSDSCTTLEEGSSKRIRSILKKNDTMKKDINTKKKVTFNLNRYDDRKAKAGTGFNLITENNMKVSTSPNPTILNCITKTNNQLVSPSTDDQNTYSETTVLPEQTTEMESNILDKIMESDSFLNSDIYTTNTNIKFELRDEKLEDSISSPELETIHHQPDLRRNPPEADSLNGINFSLEKLNSRHINREETEKETSDEEIIFTTKGSSSGKYVTVKESVSSSSIGIQSDFDRNTTTKEGVSLNLKVPFQELDESQTENMCILQENEYSSFIKDLVTGSGDRLANFLIRLSSEISSEASQEKLQSALMNAVFGDQDIINSESLQVKNEDKKVEEDNENNQMTAIEEKTLQNLDRNTEKTLETEMKPSKYKNIGKSMTNCQPNESLNNNSLKEDYFIKARKSISLINIHQLYPTASYSKGDYLENGVHTSGVSKLYGNDRNTCTERDDPFINNKGNKNDQTIGKLHELMAELRESIEKISNKESTIHIENAQIWLNDSRSYEKLPPSNQIWTQMRKSKKITEEEILASQINKTKDTYSQTILTADINFSEYLQREVTKEAENKTEIHIHSNNKNEEINIKVNEKKPHMKDLVLAVEPKENQTMYLPTIQVNTKENESLNQERGRIFENYHAPFNAVVDDDRKLPFIKRGKYEFEIFEQIDEPVIAETSFKNLINKITDQMTALKLNGLQNYQKRSSFRRHIQSSKLKIQNPTDEKPAGGNFFQSFLNKISKSNNNAGSKNGANGCTNSKQFIGLKNQFNILNSIFPMKCKGGSSPQMGSDDSTGLHNVNTYKRKQFSVNSIKCDQSSISLCDDNQWPDIIKTKYPNGMVHFGPLARMPEPAEMIVTIDRESMELDTCSYPCLGEYHQYSYNKHMVKTSVSRNINNLSKSEISLGKYSETEQKIYHWWSQVENV